MSSATDFRFATRGRWSLTPDQALAILGHSKRKLLPDYLIAEAREVQKRGVHWRWYDEQPSEVSTMQPVEKPAQRV